MFKFQHILKQHRAPQASRILKRPSSHWVLRAVLLATGFTALGVVTGKTFEPSTTKSLDVTAPISIQLALPAKDTANNHANASIDPLNEKNWLTITVRPGDSLSQMFERKKLSHRALFKIMSLGKKVAALKTIYPGETLYYQQDASGFPTHIKYPESEAKTLLIKYDGEDYQTSTINHYLERRPVYRSGIINNSLFLDAQAAGMPDNIVMELASMFGWDIDFALDIRKGDKFTVIYEEIFKNGQKIKNGNILAAEFINQEKSFRGIRYTDPSGKSGYFSPSGKSLRKTFLRSPVKFSRISSRFSKRRYHPVLHKFRAHKGVDYSASRGTPIRAAGDGKVIFRGTKGGYGRTIIIKHGSSKSTLYAHMKSYAGKSQRGRTVKQGQTIGYVGSSGLATGPHLHYEFRINGVHRNPLTVKLPDAKPVASKYWDHFRASTENMRETLNTLNNTLLAANTRH